MLTETKPLKRGPKPHGFIDMKVAITPELNSMLDQICLSTNISKAALVRDALTRYGEALGFLPEGNNPATGTELPRVQHDATFAPQFLSGAEVEALVSGLSDWTPDDVFVLVAAYSGLRSGEIQALRVGDVDVQRSRIKVQRTLVRTKDGWREDSPKSANSTRVVPMNARVVAPLADYLAEHPHRHDPSARLWPGRNYAGGGEWRGGLDWDKRMDYESFYRRRFRAAADGIGRPTLRFHDLRHTAASLWAASGMPLEMVAAALGHADTGITYKTYLHFFPDQWSRYMAGMDTFLAAPDAQVTPLRRSGSK